MSHKVVVINPERTCEIELEEFTIDSCIAQLGGEPFDYWIDSYDFTNQVVYEFVDKECGFSTTFIMAKVGV